MDSRHSWVMFVSSNSTNIACADASYNFVRESLNLKVSPGVEIMLLFADIYFRSAIFSKKIYPPRFIAWTSITYSAH